MSVQNTLNKKQVVSDSQRSTSTSGSNTVNNSNTDIIYIHEAVATVSLTVNFPITPINNQIVTIVSIGGITTLTLATGIGTIIGAITTLASGGSVRYMWLTSQSKWYKI